MPNDSSAAEPTGPDEGQYDVRAGASAYSSIIASIGSLAVTAIVVVFTVPNGVPKVSIALAAGLLTIAFMGSILGAFSFAAIGAEIDPTANIAAAVLYASVPVSLAIVGTFGAFEVLASIYIPESATLFEIMTGVAGLFAVIFTAASIPDSLGLRPTKMNAAELSAWRGRQWIQTRTQSLRIMNIVIATCGLPIAGLAGARVLFDLSVTLSSAGVTWVILLGVAFILGGVVKGFVSHPKVGNEQRSINEWDAWIPNVLIAAYTCVVLLTLP